MEVNPLSMHPVDFARPIHDATGKPKIDNSQSEAAIMRPRTGSATSHASRRQTAFLETDLSLGSNKASAAIPAKQMRPHPVSILVHDRSDRKRSRANTKTSIDTESSRKAKRSHKKNVSWSPGESLNMEPCPSPLSSQKSFRLSLDWSWPPATLDGAKPPFVRRLQSMRKTHPKTKPAVDAQPGNGRFAAVAALVSVAVRWMPKHHDAGCGTEANTTKRAGLARRGAMGGFSKPSSQRRRLRRQVA